MDKYHQCYWQNYPHFSKASDRTRSQIASDKAREQSRAEGFRDPYVIPVSERE
jgi:hypothetical protein